MFLKCPVATEKLAKLLGLTIDDNLKWRTHIYGKGGLISSLNSRLFMIKRLRNEVNDESLKKLANSLYTSKLRYGLSMFGKIWWTNEDSTTKELKDLQLNQNKMLRYLNKSKVYDRIGTETILSKQNMLSVNQLNAQIQLGDMWKATHTDNYPTKIRMLREKPNTMIPELCQMGK